MVTRAVYNWAMWLANIARSGGKPWDQTTFAGAIEWVSGEVRAVAHVLGLQSTLNLSHYTVMQVSVRHMSMAMLHPDL